MGWTVKYNLRQLKKIKPIARERLYFHPVTNKLMVIGDGEAFHPDFGYEEGNIPIFKSLGWKFIGRV